MHYELKLHPDFTAPAVQGLAVTVIRPTATSLEIHYKLTGDLTAINMAPQVASARGFELWRHTCFELFLRAPNQPAYYEFNFSPSTEWTAHRFTDRRTGVMVAEEIAAPIIRVKQENDNYNYFVSLDLSASSIINPTDEWQLAPTTVIEGIDGQQSYWALAHALGKPDFHNPDNFLCSLQPPSTQAAR